MAAQAAGTARASRPWTTGASISSISWPAAAVGVGVAEAYLAARVSVDDNQRGAVPGDGAVRLGVVGRDRVGGHFDLRHRGVRPVGCRVHHDANLAGPDGSRSTVQAWSHADQTTSRIFSLITFLMIGHAVLLAADQRLGELPSLVHGGVAGHGRFVGIDHRLAPAPGRAGRTPRASTDSTLAGSSTREAAGAAGAGVGGEVDGLQIHAELRVALEHHLLPLDLPQGVVLDDDHLDGQACT